MGKFPNGFKKIALRLILVATPVGCVYLYLVEIGLMWTPSTCMTETVQEIADPSGYDFKVTETGCSTIAKEGFVSVYISRAHRNNPILLFKYDPAGALPYPSITVSDKGHVTIAMPVLSEIILQRHKWREVWIDYDIGHVMFPAPNGKAE